MSEARRSQGREDVPYHVVAREGGGLPWMGWLGGPTVEVTGGDGRRRLRKGPTRTEPEV